MKILPWTLNTQNDKKHNNGNKQESLFIYIYISSESLLILLCGWNNNIVKLRCKSLNYRYCLNFTRNLICFKFSANRISHISYCFIISNMCFDKCLADAAKDMTRGSMMKKMSLINIFNKCVEKINFIKVCRLLFRNSIW